MKNYWFIAVFFLLIGSAVLAADEPETLNPFAPKSSVREDARKGTIETSDGKSYQGMIYLTRDRRLKIYDEKKKRQREIPLRVVARIDAVVKWERMEKQWQFQELAADKKLYSGKEYPAREYTYTVTLKDGRKVTGPMSAVIYQKIQVSLDEPLVEKRFLLHKRQKGEPGTALKNLIYVKAIDFGEKVAKDQGKDKDRVSVPKSVKPTRATPRDVPPRTHRR